MLKIYLFRLLINLMPFFLWRGKTPAGLAVQDINADTGSGTLRLRTYRPPGDGPFPVTLYFHGGGFVVGSVTSCDPICREIAAGAGHIVVSVNYRLAPEHAFPAAAEDALAALDWLAAHGAALGCDMNNVFVAGDSAGGNLAAVTAREARQRQPGLLRGQLLVFPVTDHYCSGHDSFYQPGKRRAMGRRLMCWFWDRYYQHSTVLAAGQYHHRLSTPLAMDDHRQLPATLLIVAGDDPLRDEGLAYGKKLQDAGVEVQLSLYADDPHGFIGYMGPTASHRKGMNEIIAWLGRLRH
ncbi:MAG TPA: alpha/beta hydrolase [Pseudomonadales bacterium]